MTPKEDLQRSGLSEETIAAMRVRELTAEELSRRGVQGAAEADRIAYLIPYFDLDGNVIPGHSRVRLLPPILTPQGKEIKYLQAKGTGNHAYLPPVIPRSVWEDTSIPLYITEGEKKAAAGAQQGLATVGLGGVWSWRSRNLVIPQTQVTTKGKVAQIRLSPDEEVSFVEQVVPELKQLKLRERSVEIVFDSDYVEKESVQDAAFELSVWLQEQGAHDVKVVLLPHKPNPGKCGLDDYFRYWNLSQFYTLQRVPAEHPDVYSWIKRRLNEKDIHRNDYLKVARGILSGLDAKGQRYTGPNDRSYYYWDRGSSVLHAFRWDASETRQMRLTSFGSLMHDRFGVGTTDHTIMGRVADLFASAGDLRSVEPRRISYSTENTLYYQLSDSFLAKVDANNIEVVENGTDGQLFLSDQVHPLILPQELLVVEPKEPMWIETLREVNIQPFFGMTLEQTQIAVAALYYLSPLFRRWRGMMLPIEVVTSEPNSGKAQPLDAGILTPTGWKTMGEMVVGQDLIGVDGKRHKVIGVFPQGKKDIYRVTFTDGTSTECCKEHLWEVTTNQQRRRNKGGQVKTLEQIAEQPLKSPWGAYINHVPLNAPVEFDEPAGTLPIDPYLLGLLLGDGQIKYGTSCISSADTEIFEEVAQRLPAGCYMAYINDQGQAKQFRLSGPGKNQKNPLTEALRDLGLQGTGSHTKFIPQQYLLSSPEQRLELLRGLMDTDGDGRSVFTSVSPLLIEGVAFLVRSLGGVATIWKRPNHWRVGVALNMNPYKLPRKASQWSLRKQKPCKAVKSVEYVGEKEAQCILTDAPRNLYLTDGLIATHNSMLMNLRRGILTGSSSLDNPPLSLKDAYAQWTAAKAIWVCDNLGDLPRDLREIFSDELARLTTDPEPKVEMRQLYTTAGIATMPIDCTFAITSIREPFWKTDIQQRSLRIQLAAIPEGQRDSGWYHRKLSGLGRARRVADQLHMAQRFFKEVAERWNDNYLSQHRLVHFEQSLILMIRAMGYESEAKLIAQRLFGAVKEQILSGDPLMTALRVFVDEWKKGPTIRATDIVNWASMDMAGRFGNLRVLQNPTTLSRYMAQHAYEIQTGIGIAPAIELGRGFFRITRKEQN
jgi:hypothetical protein